MADQSDNKGGQRRPLYPLGLTALGVALFGTLWTGIDEGPQLEPSAELEPLERVEEVGPGLLEEKTWDAPLELKRQDDGPVQFTLNMRQIGGEPDNREPSLDFRARFGGVERMERVDGREVLQRDFALSELEFLRDADLVDEQLVRLISHESGSVTRRDLVRGGGWSDGGGWLDDQITAPRPLEAVAAGLVDAMMPRPPAEPLLVGERWSYRLSEPLSVDGLGFDSQVEERLVGVYGDDERQVAAIDRRLTVEVNRSHRLGPDAASAPKLIVEGRGVAYFDVGQGRPVASNLRAEQIDVEAEEQRTLGTIKAAWFKH